MKLTWASRIEATAISASLLMLVSGRVFVLFIFAGSHQVIEVPARYGLALVPFAPLFSWRD